MEIDAIIEDPRGSTVRHFQDRATGVWVAKPHAFTSNPWPVSYGYIPDTLNPVDGDALDIMVLARDALETGSRIRVRPVGMLRRPDGDDKILGVLIGDPDLGGLERLSDVPGREIEEINDWFAVWDEVGEWFDEADARRRVDEARAHAG